VYLILSLLFLFAILPLWLWRPSRKLFFPVLALFAIKIYTLKDLIDGIRSVCHDALGLQFAFAMTRDWQVSQVAMDWNPFLTAGQPFAVMTNFVFWVPVIILARLAAFLQVELPALQFSNAIYLYLFFQMCTGTVMLLQLLYKNKAVSLFGAASIILGGFFTENAYGPNGFELLTFVPYLLFFLVHFLRHRQWFALAFFSLFLGDTFNHYNPVYLALFGLFFLAALGVLPDNPLRGALREALSRPLRLAICAGLFLIVFAPGLYGFYEMRDYVSPTRGFTQYGEIDSARPASQAGMFAKPAYYTGLIDRSYLNPIIPTPGQYGFYLGVAPFFLLFLALPLILKNPLIRALALSSVALFVFSLGSETRVWAWLQAYVPFVSLIRHTAGFSPWISLIVLIISMGGVRALMSRRIDWRYKLGASTSALACWVALRGDLNTSGYWYVSAFVLILSAAIPAHLKSVKIAPKLFLLPLFLFHAADTGSFSQIKADDTFCRYKSYPVPAMRYPTDWRSTCVPCKVSVPLDFWPVIDKKTTWVHPDPNYVYMMPKGFVDFQNGVKENGFFYGQTFYLLPEKRDWAVFFADLFKKKNLEAGSLGEMGTRDGSKIKVMFHEAIKPLQVETSADVLPIASGNPNRVTLVTQSENTGYLLRLETYHRGWRAFVDEVETAIESVPPTFQMIRVPAGEHRVRFEFHSPYPNLMRVATFAVVFGWLLALCWFGGNGRAVGIARYALAVAIVSVMAVWFPLPKLQHSGEAVSPALLAGDVSYESNIAYTELPVKNILDKRYYANVRLKDVSVKNLFDGDENTAWVTPDEKGVSGWIIKRFDKPHPLNAFSMTVQDRESAPLHFEISASLDAEHWDVVGIFNDVKWAPGEKTKVFMLGNNSRPYRYYKLSDFSNTTPSLHLLNELSVTVSNPEAAPSRLSILGSRDMENWEFLGEFSNVKWTESEKTNFFWVHLHEHYPHYGVNGFLSKIPVSINLIWSMAYRTDDFSHKHSAHVIITELDFGTEASQ
jgi:hypothetical protein